jgi:diaminopimelate epimerase
MVPSMAASPHDAATPAPLPEQAPEQALKQAKALPYRRLHGCGNDYVYFDGWVVGEVAFDVATLQALADRHTGIGGDGVIWIGPPRQSNNQDIQQDDNQQNCNQQEHGPISAIAEMRMWNADGSSSEMCGNGLRCAVKVAFDAGHLGAGTHAIRTGAGVLQATITGQPGNAEHQVCVDMGAPRLTPAAVPTTLPEGGTPQSLEVADTVYEVVAVGMGNPHAVVFVEDPATAPVTTVGPLIEHHPAFPARTNVEFVSVNADGSLSQRTWERGSGETMACGTGACAAAVAAIATGRCAAGTVSVHLLGGTLAIAWQPGAHCLMTGPATAICAGTVNPQQLTGPLAPPA